MTLTTACAYGPVVQATLWQQTKIGGQDFSLINLEHPEVDARVIAEMETGVEVYYDRRWSITQNFTEWLAKDLSLFAGKKVLILGAGVGAETVLLGQHAEHVWLNDLAPAALELCAEQMTQNGLSNFTCLLGRYEELSLPTVDLVVGSFLIYNDETLAAMQSFLQKHTDPVILVNERLAPFPKFLKSQPHSIAFQKEDAIGVFLENSAPS